jgi:hypothetical protein
MNTKKEAEKLGQELLSHMKGNGWELRIWENLGWHYSVTNNLLEVYPSSNGKYFCLFGYKSGGRPEWTIKESFDNPNEAVERTLQLARNNVNELLKIVEDGEKVIKA